MRNISSFDVFICDRKYVTYKEDGFFVRVTNVIEAGTKLTGWTAYEAFQSFYLFWCAMGQIAHRDGLKNGAIHDRWN